MEITKELLAQALREWEIDARCGRTITREESVTMSLDEATQRSTDALWSILEIITTKETA